MSTVLGRGVSPTLYSGQGRTTSSSSPVRRRALLFHQRDRPARAQLHHLFRRLAQLPVRVLDQDQRGTVLARFEKFRVQVPTLAGAAALAVIDDQSHVNALPSRARAAGVGSRT